MARRRDRRPREDRPERGFLDERRRLLAAGSLFAAVVAVVVLGALLRSDASFEEAEAALAETDRSRPAPVESRPAEPPVPTDPGEAVASREVTVAPGGGTTSGEPSPTAGPARAVASEPDVLEARASTDRGRLSRSGGSFTLQLMVACDPDNARRALRLSGETARLYLLPVDLSGRRCYRFCWGSYASREEAGRARDLPSSIRAEFPDPRPRAIADVTS